MIDSIIMRTTLTLEPQIAECLRQEAKRGNRSFKQIVNDALALGLGLKPPCPPREPYRLKPHASEFLPGIDPGKLNQLADELEAIEFTARHTAKVGA
jgi:hypothetical protein